MTWRRDWVPWMRRHWERCGRRLTAGEWQIQPAVEAGRGDRGSWWFGNDFRLVLSPSGAGPGTTGIHADGEFDLLESAGGSDVQLSPIRRSAWFQARRKR